MKIFFIIILFSSSIVAQNNLPAMDRINNLLKMQRASHLFYVQIGAFKNKRYATIIYKKLRKMHYPLKIEKRKIGLDKYFKLLIGPFRTKKEAYSMRDSLPKKYRDSFILTEDN